ncbi:MAG: translation initiation factor [Acidobacteriota bacterium]|nr:translation initiation factor [Acidobacteriota bacterium]
MASSKLVWTSDPEEARRLRESGKLEARVDLPVDSALAKQTIRVTLDKKRRAGKTVTVASGFQHTSETLAAAAQTLKKKCGSGGTAKDGEIELQGDHVTRVKAELERMGYRVK